VSTDWWVGLKAYKHNWLLVSVQNSIFKCVPSPWHNCIHTYVRL